MGIPSSEEVGELIPVVNEGVPHSGPSPGPFGLQPTFGLDVQCFSQGLGSIFHGFPIFLA